MATRPNMVPEDQPWLIIQRLSGDQPILEVVVERSSKRECLEWLLEARTAGDTLVYFIYGPDSRHEFVVSNQIVWERAGG